MYVETVKRRSGTKRMLQQLKWLHNLQNYRIKRNMQLTNVALFLPQKICLG